VKCFRAAAEQGHLDAQLNLGNAYADGRGVRRNKKEAIRWYLKAAEAGLAPAQHALGVLHCYGRGKPNYPEAVRWYRRAAEQGHAGAQNNLGIMYEAGRGVAIDLVAAYVWYSLAVLGDSAGSGHGQAIVREENDSLRRSLKPNVASAFRPQPEPSRGWRWDLLGAGQDSEAGG
jgi:uncharacterized protein